MERVRKQNSETANRQRVAQAKFTSRSRENTFSKEIDESPAMVAQRKKLDGLFGGAIQRVEEEEPLQGKFETTQRVEDEEPLQGKFETTQRVEDEEPLQGKFETTQRVEDEEPLQGRFETTQRVEDEEPLQGKFAVAQMKHELGEEEFLPGKFGTTQRVEEEEPLQGKAVQRVEEEESLQGKFESASSVQLKDEAAKPNNTGLPDNLKSGIESLSGVSMDNVKVHYNSSQPAQLNARAYAQGTDIHVAPGQEQHLPHEAWHVVQQTQGRVHPTMQMKEGIPVNDDKSLEHEADVMGAKAASMDQKTSQLKSATNGLLHQNCRGVAQMVGLGERPFENAYVQILNNSKWFPKAISYEKRLGSYAYGHGKSSTALGGGITKLHTVIKNHYNDPVNYESTLREAFFKNEKSSAGQVGLNLNVDEMLDVLNNGNLRERMTAFYNAAYFAGGYGDNIKKGFKQILHEIVFESNVDESTQRARNLGLDEDAINEQLTYYRQLTSAKGWLRGGAEYLASFIGKDYLFAKDIFALGNLSMQSSFSDLKEIADSQKDRTVREEDEQERLSNTPEDYAKMGTPLSDRELQYAFPEITKPLLRFWEYETTYRRRETEKSKLPWREGSTYFTISPRNSWYQKIHNQLKMPIVAGVSGTTTRMLTAYKFLGLGAPIDFRLAIMGWMLTSWDHSLYEILRGSHIAGIKPPGEEERMKDVIRMYMTVAPLDTAELRANVANNKMFPHEEIYTDLAKERNQSKDHLKAPTADVAESAESKLEHAESNDLTGETTNISKAHAIAITGYTSGIHSLLNTVMSFMSYPDTIGIKVVKSKLNAVVDACQAGEPVEWINVLDPKKTEILALHGMDAEDQRTARAEIDTWIDQLAKTIYPELKMHANMTIEGMSNLPSVNGITVYRGDWKSKVGSMYKVGGEITSNTFASYSKKRSVAAGFASQYDNTWTSHPVLIELALSGVAGKDVKKYSEIGGEDEVLLMPGAKITLQSSRWEKIGGKDVEVFTGIETR